MKRIEIGVGSLKGGLREFARVWRRAAAGGRLPEATPKGQFGLPPPHSRSTSAAKPDGYRSTDSKT